MLAEAKEEKAAAMQKDKEAAAWLTFHAEQKRAREQVERLKLFKRPDFVRKETTTLTTTPTSTST